ncbi:vWA domain-containing protein [Trichloromonas sp.]|uniref:vWA domain-containing protein n=1 Tax=Trichloromonas sp. TaxID=3069249 RepID=UPI003D81A382
MLPRIRLFQILFVFALLSFGGFAAAASPPLIGCDLALDQEVLPAGSSQSVVIKVSLDVPVLPRQTARPPVNLALVFDRSGSMSGSKIEKARQAAVEALRRLGPGDLFSLVVYDHQVQTLVSAQSAANTEWIESQIRSIHPGGNTALFGAVSQGAAEVRRHVHQPYVHRVILLSDGLANVGPSAPEDLARLGAALLKEGISVTTIGIGTDFNEDLMTRLAARSDGNHYFVEDSRDLSRIFAAELGDVLSVAARRVVVEVECPAGVRPLRVIGREGRIRGNRVEIQMNQLYGGQEKFALIEVEVPASRSGQTMDLATANCSYENALTARVEKSSARIQARFSASQAEVREGANKAVQEAVVENEMAVARDQALDLYNAGRKDEAAQALRQTSAELKAKSSRLGFDDLAGEAAALESDAAEFSADKLSSPRKKELRSESYRVRSQQKEY